MSVDFIKSIPNSGSVQESSLRFINLKNEKTYISEIEQLFEKNIAPLYGSQSHALSKIKEGQDRECEILMQDKKIIGLIVYKNRLSDYTKYGISNSLEVKNIFISNPENNSKYEQLLINRIIEVAKQKFAKGIYIITAQNSPFYSTNNFTTKTSWKHTTRPNEYLMYKALENEKTTVVSEEKKDSSDSSSTATSSSFHSSSIRPKRKIEFNPENEKKRRITPPTSSFKFTPTHHVTLRKKYIHEIKEGKKTIEGRIANGIFLSLKEGNKIRFFYTQNSSDDVTCTITKIAKYSSFQEMLQKEDYKKCVPEATSLNNAISIYNSIPNYKERALKHGVLAIHLKI